LREEQTKFSRRVYYSACEVPGMIDEAREMFWEPFRYWRARLRLNRWSGPRYVLDFRVDGREVFAGWDDDVALLLVVFQAFLDEHADHVDEPGFRRLQHPPAAADHRP
jgi:hypothetical protein